VKKHDFKRILQCTSHSTTGSWNCFVLRTDVNHLVLLDQLAVHIEDRRVLNMCGARRNGAGRSGTTIKAFRSAARSAPLIGAFFLTALDATATKPHLFYIRFMDDILILAPRRWQLRGAVKVVNQTLAALSLEKHPGQDLHPQDRTRLRLSRLPFQSDGG
jgi:hypothetical protein